MLVVRNLVLSTGAFLLCAHLNAETWTNAQGQTFEAEFLRTEGMRVLFRLESGREFSNSLLDLSSASQKLIRQRVGAPIEELRSNFGRPWPRSAGSNGNSGCKIISEDKKKAHYIYESPGYRFHCDARITHDALSNFALVFESTRAYLAALPISLMSREILGTRSRVLLFGEKETYFKSGGSRGSAGCFLPKHRLVLIPMDSLGLVKGGTGYGRDLEKENQILVHELVHQLTPAAYYAHGSRGWFSEGLAEYVASTPYNNGVFRPDIRGNSVLAYVTARGEDGRFGRNLGTEISAPPLKDFMLMGYSSFSGDQANRNYALGLLLTHYFFHMEGGGKARRITKFLKGLHAGNKGEAALAPLLDRGDFKKLEKDISSAWRRKGVTIRFGG